MYGDNNAGAAAGDNVHGSAEGVGGGVGGGKKKKKGRKRPEIGISAPSMSF